MADVDELVDACETMRDELRAGVNALVRSANANTKKIAAAEFDAGESHLNAAMRLCVDTYLPSVEAFELSLEILKRESANLAPIYSGRKTHAVETLATKAREALDAHIPRKLKRSKEWAMRAYACANNLADAVAISNLEKRYKS